MAILIDENTRVEEGDVIFNNSDVAVIAVGNLLDAGKKIVKG